MTQSHEISPAVAPVTPSAFAIAICVLKKTWVSWKNRRNAARLFEADDYMLHDIGLTRHDLRQAFRLSHLGDPSPHLIEFSRQFGGDSSRGRRRP